jgi:hypothetical protein
MCDHSGCPTWYSGPHLGTIHDSRLIADYPPPLIPNENILADKAYQGGGPTLIVPFKKQRNESRIVGVRRAFNLVHRWYRATVEHSIGFVKRFRILSGVYRGRLPECLNHIENALTIIIHISAYHISLHPRRTHPVLYNDDDTDSDQSDDNDSDFDDHPSEDEIFDEENWDPQIGTGKAAADFHRQQRVLFWWEDDWWNGIITHINTTTNTVNVKVEGTDEIIRGFLPKHVRVFVED